MDTKDTAIPTVQEAALNEQRAWHMLSHIVIRRAGFPFEWLVQLASPAIAELAESIVMLQEDTDAHIRKLLTSTFPEAVDSAHKANNRQQLRALSKLRHKIGRRRSTTLVFERYSSVLPEHVNTAIKAVDGLQQRLEALYTRLERALTEDIQHRREMLRTIVADPFFQEAIFISNPDLYKNSLKPFLQSSERKINPAFERRLLAYLQRFCAKNDTASFFGPLNCGRIVAQQEQPILVERHGMKYARREAYISFWVVNRLAGLISAEPGIQAYLNPRPHPQCLWEGESIYFFSHERRVRLSPLQQEILRRADSTHTTREIAESIGQSLEAVIKEINRLAAARVLICRLEVPSTIFHPLTYLLQRIEKLPEKWERRSYWLDQLQFLDQLRAQFITADLPQRQEILARIDAHYSAITGESPRRGAGSTYADRTPLYEECEGTYEKFQFSKKFFDDFQKRLEPILNLSAAHGTLLREHYQNLGKSVFHDLSPNGSPIAYARFITAVQQRQRAGKLSATSVRLERLRDNLAHMVEQQSDGRVAKLSIDDLSQVLSDIKIADNCHISPDVMLAAPSFEKLCQGEYQLVLGESHQVIYVWGSQLYFYPRRSDAEEEMQSHIGHMAQYTGLATILNERQHKGLLYEAFPGTFIEVAAIPSQHAQARIPLVELDVVLEDDQLLLRHRDTGQLLRLYTAGDEQLHLWALAVPRVMPIPVRLGTHTPRIEINGAVYQRERWQLPTSEWRGGLATLTSAGLFVRAQKIITRHHIPRYVFVHVASEPKPYYIDFANVFCLELLRQLLLVNEYVTFTEMHPGPEQLWLTEDNQHFCCEFRMTACRY